MRPDLSRWPLLVAASVLLTVGLGVDLITGATVAAGVIALAAACIGAFLYAEGARHREWWSRHDDDG